MVTGASYSRESQGSTSQHHQPYGEQKFYGSDHVQGRVNFAQRLLPRRRGFQALKGPVENLAPKPSSHWTQGKHGEIRRSGK